MRDKAPASVGGELDPMIEESVRGNAGKYEEPAPNDSSLGRILNPSRYQDNNQDDVDIPNYHGSVRSIGGLHLSRLFGHIGSKVIKKGRRPHGRGLSNVLGRKLKIHLPSQKPKVVGQRSKFVLSEDIFGCGYY